MIHNAITEAFSQYAVQQHYGVAKAKAMATRLFNDVQLSKDDQPLPEWALKLLTSPIVGYRERVRIALLHHRDLTGKEIKCYLVSKMGKRPTWLNRLEAQKNGLVMKKQREESKMEQEEK